MPAQQLCGRARQKAPPVLTLLDSLKNLSAKYPNERQSKPKAWSGAGTFREVGKPETFVLTFTVGQLVGAPNRLMTLSKDTINPWLMALHQSIESSIPWDKSRIRPRPNVIKLMSKPRQSPHAVGLSDFDFVPDTCSKAGRETNEHAGRGNVKKETSTAQQIV